MNPRLQKLRKLLSEKKLDALLVSSLPNISYLTTFAGFTTEDRDAYLLITKKKQYIFTHAIYREVAIQNFKEYLLVDIKRENPISYALKNIMEKEKIKKLGFEAFDLTVRDYEKLTKQINKKLLEPADLVSTLRIVKDSAEIQTIKKACLLGDKTFTFILTKLKTGITEKELAVEIEYFIKRHEADISFTSIVAFGPNASQPHHIPNETKLKKNNFVLFDFGTKLNNYCSDMTRTIFFGKANKNQSKLYHTVLNAQIASIEYIKTRLQSKETIPPPSVDQLMRHNITAQEYTPFTHSSHGIGLNVHESPHLWPASTDTIEYKMVFSIEPGVYLPRD